MVIAHLNGIDINYEVHGEGPPLVLAPGFAGTVDMWCEQVPALSAAHQLVLYDPRGHGRSSAPADVAAYSLERDFVADQLALMDHLGIADAYVGGMSMGGFIAQEFVLRHPSRVKALLLFDTAPAWAAENPAIFSTLIPIVKSQGMSVVVASLRAAVSEAEQVPEALNRFIDAAADMPIDGFAGCSQALIDWPGTLERIHLVQVPTLIVIGDADVYLEASREMQRRIGGSRLVVVKGSGHGVNMLKPKAFEAATLDFLAAVSKSDSVAGSIEIS